MEMLDLPYFHLTPGNVTDYSHLRRTISGYYVQDGVVRHDSSCIMDQYKWPASALTDGTAPPWSPS